MLKHVKWNMNLASILQLLNILDKILAFGPPGSLEFSINETITKRVTSFFDEFKYANQSRLDMFTDVLGNP